MKLYYETKEGELEHGLFGTTKPRENVKYIDKIKMPNGKYRYFYTQAELDAYRAAWKLSKGVGSAMKSMPGRIKDAAAKAKEGVLDAAGKRYYDEADEHRQRANNTRVESVRAMEDANKYKKIAKNYKNMKNTVIDESGSKAYQKLSNDATNKSAMKTAESRTKMREADEYDKRSAESRAKGDKTLYGLIQNIKKKQQKKKRRNK